MINFSLIIFNFHLFFLFIPTSTFPSFPNYPAPNILQLYCRFPPIELFYFSRNLDNPHAFSIIFSNFFLSSSFQFAFLQCFFFPRRIFLYLSYFILLFYLHKSIPTIPFIPAKYFLLK